MPLTTVAGHPPLGTAPHHPRGTQLLPQGMRAEGTVLGPHTHTPAPTARGWRTPTAPPEGGQSREGERLTSDAPQNGERRPPRITPFRHPHSVQRRHARAHAMGQVLGSHARTDRTQDTRFAEPRLPAPEDGRPGGGQRLTPDAPHSGGRPPPPGTPPHHPRGAQPPRGMQAEGTVPGPHIRTHAPTARGWRTQTACPEGRQSGEGERLTSDAPHNAECFIDGLRSMLKPMTHEIKYLEKKVDTLSQIGPAGSTKPRAESPFVPRRVKAFERLKEGCTESMGLTEWSDDHDEDKTESAMKMEIPAFEGKDVERFSVTFARYLY